MHISFLIKPAGVKITQKINPHGYITFYANDNTHVDIKGGYISVPMLDGRLADVSDDLREHIAQVTIENSTFFSIEELKRKSGVYRLGLAEGTVEHVKAGVRISVSAPTKKEALELWDKILDGSIAPVIDYENTQVSLSMVDNDRLGLIEKQAAELAMKLLEKAMTQLADKIK